MKAFSLLFALCHVLCVIASKRRTPIEFSMIYTLKLAEAAAEIAVTQRRVFPGRPTRSFAEDAQFAMGLSSLPKVAFPEKASDIRTVATLMMNSGWSKDFAKGKNADNSPKPKGEEYVHLIKGTTGYVSIFKQIGIIAADLKSKDLGDKKVKVNRLLDMLQSMTKDAWHERRSDSMKHGFNSLEGKIPKEKVKKIEEKFSDGTTYERWDKQGTLDASSDEEKKTVEKWVVDRRKDAVVKKHQAPIKAIHQSRKKMGDDCGKVPELPERRSIQFKVDVDAVA